MSAHHVPADCSQVFDGNVTRDHRDDLTPRLAQVAAILGWGPWRFSDDEWQALTEIVATETNQFQTRGNRHAS